MWEKSYKIAERQFETGQSSKLKSAREHATKALDIAQKSGNKEHIAKTKALLARIALDHDHVIPEGLQLLRDSVLTMEDAYGANSRELMIELQLLATAAQYGGNIEDAQKDALKALEIARSLGDTEETAAALDMYVGLLVYGKKFEEALPQFKEYLAMAEKMFEPNSLEMQELLENYVEILEGLGREDEAREMMSEEYSPEMKAVFEDAGNSAATDITDGIARMRANIEKANTIVAKEAAAVPQDLLFRSLKVQAISAPVRFLKSSLAGLLRVSGTQNSDREQLIEARDLNAECFAVTPWEEDLCREYLLTLVELCDGEDAPLEDLNAACMLMEPSADMLYSRALGIFRTFGDIPAAKAALSAALEFNSFVIAALVNDGKIPDDKFEQPSEPMEKKMREDAEQYAEAAYLQWKVTPHAHQFLGEGTMAFARRIQGKMAKAGNRV